MLRKSVLKEIIIDRLDELEAKKSAKYYAENKRYLKMLLDHFGDVDITRISKRDIKAFINGFALDLKKRGKTYEKANAMIRILNALFNTIDGYNPVKGITFYPIDKKLKYIPTNAEIEAVLKECDEEQQDLIIFCLETGCRINEALNLTYDDVLPDHVVLYTRKSRNSNLTSRKVRCILDKKGRGRVFKRWGIYPKFLEKKVRKLKQRPWAFHNLRHRKASLMSKRGIPLFEIMAHLGHSSVQTTQRYLQLLP